MANPERSLRTYLIILFLGVTLIPLGMAAILSVWRYGEDIDRIERASMQQEMGVARLAERYLLYATDSTRRAMLSISKAMVVGLPQARGRVAEEGHGNPQIKALHITDARGKILVSSREGEGLPIDDPNSFNAAKAKLETIYTNYFYSTLIDSPVVAIVLPYFDRGNRFAGVIRASISLEFLLNEFTNQYSFEERYYIFFVDRRGTLLAAQNFRPGRNSRNLKTLPPVAQLLSGRDGTLKYISTFFGDRVDGIERLGAYRHIGAALWGVVVSQPSAQVLANPMRYLVNFVVVILITAVACVGVALWVAQLLALPLNAIAKEMGKRTDQQDFETAVDMKIHSGVQEYQLLSSAYNTLMKQIQQNFEKINILNAEISFQNAILQENNAKISKQTDRIQFQLQELDILYQKVNEANVSLESQVMERTSELQAAYRGIKDKAAELEEANAKLTDVVGELRKLDQLQADFLANVSHELRTPITFVTAYGSSLEDGLLGPLAPGQKEAIHCIMEGAGRLILLVEDLLDLNRLESGSLEIMATTFEPADLIGPVVEIAKGLAHAHNQEIDVELQPGVPPVYADHDRAQQVLRNLLSNAIKFTPESGRIRVRCYQSPEGVTFEVVDNGIGIPPEAQLRLFDRFFQVDASSTRKFGGTGIGLNIVKNLMDLMGGHIEVESEVGQGSTFRVVFPQGNYGDQSAPQPGPVLAVSPNPSNGGNSTRVSFDSSHELIG